MITRSNSKKIRENLNRLPREVEATLPSWVKCTDPIPREILEEVRSTVLVWGANVRKYYEEHILARAGMRGPGFLAFYVDVNYAYGFEDRLGLIRVKEKKGAWSTFIRQMLLSDVKIIYRGEIEPTFSLTDIVFEIFERNWVRPLKETIGLKLSVYFDDDDERLSSEIKDEICSKLASALRALKSRISRICGINELERRTQSH